MNRTRLPGLIRHGQGERSRCANVLPMQGAGDRESGFRLTDAEIAEYQTLGAQYVDAACEAQTPRSGPTLKRCVAWYQASRGIHVYVKFIGG